MASPVGRRESLVRDKGVSGAFLRSSHCGTSVHRNSPLGCDSEGFSSFSVQYGSRAPRNGTS